MSELTVGDLMTPEPITVSPTTNIWDVYELMDRHHIRHLPVAEDGELVGLVSHRDLIRAVAALDDQPLTNQRAQLKYLTAAQLMIAGVETVDPGDPVLQAAEQMIEHKFGCLPVTEGTRIVGILTEADFVKFVATAER
jgi:CBS domain-containing protein